MTDAPTISSLECQVFVVPTDQPEADGTLSWDKTTIVTVELRAGDATGLGWTYASASCRPLIEDVLARRVIGSDPMDIAGTTEQMVIACRNLGRPGVVACAISAVDIALWDLKARLLGVSLAHLFGVAHKHVPIYGSGGFVTYDDERTRAQLENWLDLGARAAKIKIGEDWGNNVDRDLERTRLSRSVIGDDVELFVDANGGYRAKQAIRVGHELIEDCDIRWFEEPVSSDDLAGLKECREQLRCDIAAGEYGFDEPYFSRMVHADAIDCLQIDVTRCGGYSTFQRASAIAFGHGLQVSAHCAPHLHAPIAAATVNCRHIEYFHDHVRTDHLLFDGLPAVTDGNIEANASSLGHGISLKTGEAARFRCG
jgi:L-alanine-DL-glutamate epimerase-like enolase superfamily enzyme